MAARVRCVVMASGVVSSWQFFILDFATWSHRAGGLPPITIDLFDQVGDSGLTIGTRHPNHPHL